MNERYAKQTILPEIGPAGQARLGAASVLCVGAGGLGCAALPYLVGAGVGRVTIIDADVVDRTNLQRQVLFGEASLGQPKAQAAAQRLRDLNPLVHIEAIEQRFSAGNAEELIRGHDVIVDGSDNYPTKYLLADACVKFDRPLVYGSVTGMEAMATVFHARRGPCLRCLFPEAPTGWVPNCAEAGVLGPLVGMTGSLQAAETVKLLASPDGALNSLIGRLWIMDIRDTRQQIIAVRKRPDCAVCAREASAIELPSDELELREIGPREARELTECRLFDVREPDEFAAGHIPGAVSLPLSTLQEGHGRIPSGERCLIYCESGARCRPAAVHFKAAGYREIFSLRGGRQAWQDAAGSTRATESLTKTQGASR